MSDNNPTINFIGRSGINNGISTKVDEIPNVVPYDKGFLTLSLGGEVDSCFVQPEKFYVSQNVIVLKPQWDMPFNIKLFISTVISKESKMYYKAFVDELNRHIKTDFSFYLPVIDDGTPDWNYMDRFIETIKIKYANVTKEQLINKLSI